MAVSKKIEGKDLIAEGYLKDAIGEAEKFLQVITQTKKVIQDTNKLTSDKLKSSKGTASKDLKDQNALMAESAKQRTLLVKAEEAELTALTKLDKAKKAAADFDKKKFADDDKAIKMIERQNSAYAKASDQLNKLRKEYKDLAIAGKAADESSKAMLATIQKLDKELKDADASVGQFNRHVGDYKNQMKGAISETGILSAGLNKLGAESEAIATGFGKITEQLQELKKAEDAGTKGAFTLKNALKATGITALIAVIGALFSYFTSSREGAQKFELALNKIKGIVDILLRSLKGLAIGIGATLQALWYAQTLQVSKAYEAYKQAQKGFEEFNKALTTEAIETQISAYDELTKQIYKNEDAIMQLSIAQQQANLDEEDFNEIAADTTRSLNEQKEALDNAAKARRDSAQIAVKIANLEYDSAQKQIEIDLRKNGVTEDQINLLKKSGYQEFLNSSNTLKVTPEAIKAIHEKFLAQKEVADKLDDLDRQEAMRRRELAQNEIILEVELIRSKKLGADAQVQILNKQIADEKNQLEDREKFEEELRKKQLDAQAEEIRLLAQFKTSKNEQAISEEKIQELINEKDAVKLANNIKLLRDGKLSEAQATELAKVILESQNAQIAYDDQLKKNEEERIKREEKILQLNQEISIINEQSKLDEVSAIEAERQKILEQSNAQILQSENVFNTKLVQQRQDAADQEQAIIDTEFSYKKDLLQKQYELDKQNIENTVNDDLIKSKELEKIDATYASNVNKLSQEQTNKQQAFDDKEAEQKRLQLNKEAEIVTTALQNTTQALSTELDRRSALQDSKRQLQLDKTQTAIDKQRDLANRGLANQLAFEEASAAKQQLAQQDALKKQAKAKADIALAEALMNAYNAELKQPNSNPSTAAAKALADVLVFKGIAAGLVQFAADGNDDVQGPGTTKSDSIPFMLSKHEGVVNADANMNNPGAVAALNAGKFSQLYMPRYDISKDMDGSSTALNIAHSLMLQRDSEILKVLTEIKNKPVQHIDVDKFNNLIETVHLNGMKTVTKYKNRRSIG